MGLPVPFGLSFAQIVSPAPSLTCDRHSTGTCRILFKKGMRLKAFSRCLPRSEHLRNGGSRCYSSLREDAEAQNASETIRFRRLSASRKFSKGRDSDFVSLGP